MSIQRRSHSSLIPYWTPLTVSGGSDPSSSEDELADSPQDMHDELSPSPPISPSPHKRKSADEITGAGPSKRSRLGLNTTTARLEPWESDDDLPPPPRHRNRDSRPVLSQSASQRNTSPQPGPSHASYSNASTSRIPLPRPTARAAPTAVITRPTSGRFQSPDAQDDGPRPLNVARKSTGKRRSLGRFLTKNSSRNVSASAIDNRRDHGSAESEGRPISRIRPARKSMSALQTSKGRTKEPASTDCRKSLSALKAAPNKERTVSGLTGKRTSMQIAEIIELDSDGEEIANPHNDASHPIVISDDSDVPTSPTKALGTSRSSADPHNSNQMLAPAQERELVRKPPQGLFFDSPEADVEGSPSEMHTNDNWVTSPLHTTDELLATVTTLRKSALSPPIESDKIGALTVDTIVPAMDEMALAARSGTSLRTSQTRHRVSSARADSVGLSDMPSENWSNKDGSGTVLTNRPTLSGPPSPALPPATPLQHSESRSSGSSSTGALSPHTTGSPTASPLRTRSRPYVPAMTIHGSPLYSGPDGFFKDVHRRRSSGQSIASSPPSLSLSAAAQRPAKSTPGSIRSPSSSAFISDVVRDIRSPQRSSSFGSPVMATSAPPLSLNPLQVEQRWIEPSVATSFAARNLERSSSSPVMDLTREEDPGTAQRLSGLSRAAEDVPMVQSSAAPTTRRVDVVQSPGQTAQSPVPASDRTPSVGTRRRKDSEDSLARSINAAKLKQAEKSGQIIDLTLSDTDEDDTHTYSAHPSDEEAAQASSRLLDELLHLEGPSIAPELHQHETTMTVDELLPGKPSHTSSDASTLDDMDEDEDFATSTVPFLTKFASEERENEDTDEEARQCEDLLYDDADDSHAETPPSSHAMTPESMVSDEASASYEVRPPRRNPPRNSRSASNSASSTSLPEWPDVPIFNPPIVMPRTHSAVAEQLLIPAMNDVHIDDDEIQILTWDKDGKPLAKEFANFYQLAKDIPHDLQDYVNNMNSFARHNDGLLIIFESMISENTCRDEPRAPDIKVINDVDDDEPTPPFEFHYSNLMWHGDKVPKPDLTNLKGCGCRGASCDPNSKTCSCVKRQQEYYQTIGLTGFAYDGKGRLRPELHSYPIYECNIFCGCGEECRNRVVQHGRKIRVNIEKTVEKGWGIFAVDRIPANTFVGIYAGEYLTDADGNERGAVYNQCGRTYLFDIDFWHLKINDPDKPVKYCVDAFHAGNFTRYLNHSCDPNCQLSPCYINEANIEKPLLAIFTRKDVASGEELCFSYWGPPEDGDTDDDDDERPPEDGNRDAPIYVKCRCGSKNCKGKMWL